MRKIFIDVGAGDGNDITEFYKMYSKNDWEVYAFECNKERVKNIKKKHPNVKVINAAVTDFDGSIDIFLTKHLNSTSIKNRRIKNNETNKESPKQKVTAIDLDNWLMENFNIGDEIILLLDVEGAEYDILNKMKNNSINIINELYVEFHGKKLVDFDMEIENNMINYLIDKFKDNVYIYKNHNHKQFIKLNPEGK